MKRKTYLDLARVIAIISVIIIHTVTGISDVYPDRMTQVQLSVYGCIKALSTFGVPFFLMISGALMLRPEKDISWRTLLFKYIRRMILALLLFGTVYSLAELIMTQKGMPAWKYLPQAIFNVFTGNTWGHMWYLYMLIGLYLILPILKGFTAYTDYGMYKYVLIVLFIFNSLFPLVKSCTGVSIGVEIPFSTVYVFYFLMGYFLTEYVDVDRKLLLKATVALAICVVFIILSFIIGLKWDVQYYSPVIVVMSLAGYILVLGGKERKFRLCSSISKYVFGMYLVHALFLNIFYKFLDITPLECGGYILLPVFAIIVFGLSLITSIAMYQIPFMRKYIM